MESLDRKISDMLSTGAILDEDAHAMLTFAQFLEELGPAPGKDGFTPDHPLGTQDALDAFRQRWLPYIHGESDGPVSEG